MTLTFNDTVAPQFATVAVTVAGGEPVEVRTTVDGDQVLADTSTLDTTAQGAAAAWQVVYRVVAADGHPITGTIDFTVTAPVPELEPATPTTSTPTTAAPAAPEPSTSPTPTPQPEAPVDADDTEAQEGDSESGLGVAVGLAALVVAVILITVAAILARRIRSQ